MRERWLSKRAVTLHIAVLFFVPACGAAAWWQITRAEDGNGLSYLYSVEWPIFAILAAYFWWMLIHTDYETVGLKGMHNRTAAAAAPTTSPTGAPDASTPVPTSAPAEVLAPVAAQARDIGADESDPELAAYNARLAELSAQGAKTWRRPETHVVRRSS